MSVMNNDNVLGWKKNISRVILWIVIVRASPSFERYMEEVNRYCPVLDAACDPQDAWTDNSAVIMMTMSGTMLPFPSSQVNADDLAAVWLPGQQTAMLRLLLSSSSPLVATVTVVVIVAVVVATAAAVVVVVVKPTITRAGVVGATVVKAVPSSSP
jgi:hypothetical protein